MEGIDPEDYDAKEVQRQCRLMRSSFDSANGAGDEYEPTERDENGELKADLLAYVRTTFLETVRAHYWQSVQSGKIGTQAFTAQLLVYSVDKGIDVCLLLYWSFWRICNSRLVGIIRRFIGDFFLA